MTDNNHNTLSYLQDITVGTTVSAASLSMQNINCV